MTIAERETAREKEQRLQYKADHEQRPWFARIQDWYQAGRVVTFISPFAIAALLLVSIGFGNGHRAWETFVATPWFYAVWPAAFVFFYARDIWERIEVRWAELEHATEKAIENRRTKKINSKAPVVKTIEVAESKDTYTGISIGLIARTLAEDPAGKLPARILKGIGLTGKAPQRVQAILRERTFLVYPRGLKSDPLAMGEEPIAYENRKDSNTITLNPLLLRDEVKAGDRARIIGNAIRRDRGLTLEPEPRIVADRLTVMGTPLSHDPHSFKTRPAPAPPAHVAD